MEGKSKFFPFRFAQNTDYLPNGILPAQQLAVWKDPDGQTLYLPLVPVMTSESAKPEKRQLYGAAIVHQADPKAADQKAMSVAHATHASEQPELTILFGSRARGDHHERSDIDIMLVQASEPNDQYKEVATRRAENTARKIYGRHLPVQLVWRTLNEFRERRRYTNSVETRAVREGTIMSGDPENPSAHNFEGEETEFDWSPYDEHLRHAESHLEMFQLAARMAPHNDMGIGQQAQNTLEFAMKALLEAHEAPYEGTHNIAHLLGNIRRGDDGLQNFSLSIPPDIYTAYEGDLQYRRRQQPRLTEFPDYLERTTSDAERIINRARQVRSQREQSNC